MVHPRREPELPISPQTEEALFDRLLRRAKGEIEAAGRAAAEAAESAAKSAREAADVVGAVASELADGVAFRAKGAADFVWDTLPDAAKDTTRAAKRIRDSRTKKGGEQGEQLEEEITQLLFRVPASLRDEVKRLALDEKRQMEELLTEGVLDLLLKYRRMPKLLEKLEALEK